MTLQPITSASDLRFEPTDFGASGSEWNDWKWQYANRLTLARDLERIPWLIPEEMSQVLRVIRHYPYAITPYLLSLIRWQDPQDPIRRQVLPSLAEILHPSAGSPDPLSETAHTQAPGLIHRYPDRVVVLATHRCAVYCRHCFRKRLWTERPSPYDASRWERAIDYLESHTEIRDVLLSGGDPLTLTDRELNQLLNRIYRIPHVEIIRIGTRLPVVLPQRITPDLCQVLEKYRPLWLVTQFNHPLEITPESAQACERLLRCGVPVNNQTVLLRNVNDQANTIMRLCQGLLQIGVRPYYLHQCDPVTGAEHFRTPLSKGTEIIACMQGTTSGLAVPRFVVDLGGDGGKVSMEPECTVSQEGNRVFLRNYAGEVFSYEDPSGLVHTAENSPQIPASIP
jgi:lysine 2,3-aminomutase